MSFLHTRDAGTLSSRCTLCGHVIRARADRDVYIGQRLHDPLTCQQRRTENARPVLVEPERVPGRPSQVRRPEPEQERTHCGNGHDWTPENVYTNPRGQRHCKVCRRAQRAVKKSDDGSCVSPAMTTELEGRPWDNSGIKTAPIISRGLTAKTIEES